MPCVPTLGYVVRNRNDHHPSQTSHGCKIAENVPSVPGFSVAGFPCLRFSLSPVFPIYSVSVSLLRGSEELQLMEETMPARPTTRAEGEMDDGVVFVLGAGVDRVFGLPLLNTLFHDLGEFARGAGRSINAAIRKHAKPLPLDLQTYGGDQAENLGQKLLGSNPDLLPRIITALDKHRDAANPRVNTVRTLMKKLSVIANENELNEAIMSEVSKLAGQTDTGVTDTLLDPNHIAFRPKVREAIKTVFTEAVTEIPDLTPEERAAFAEIITLLSNLRRAAG